MDYFKNVEVLAKKILIDTDEYFDRHIRSALEDYSGAFIIGISHDSSELMILDTDSNGFALGEQEAEMEYIHKVLFEKEVPMYLYGKDDKVAEIDREKAFDIYVAFCVELFSHPRTANIEMP